MSETFEDVDYASRCSEKTLQSANDGFFLGFADHLAGKAGKTWIEKTFGKLKLDKERIRILYEYEPVKSSLIQVLSNVEETYRKKSSEIAAERRKDADKCFKENNLIKSLSLYSQSVLRAQKTGENLEIDNGKTLSLGLFARSRLLMDMNRYEYALEDIRLALKENIPEHIQGEAYFNLAVCYKVLDEDKKANVAFAVAKKLLKLDEEILLKRYLNEVSGGSRYKKEVPRQISLPKITGKPHKFLPNAVSKLEVKMTPSLGKHVVSRENIKTGDTLVVEAPEAACLLPNAFGNHCHNCLKRLIAPVGCTTCSNVAFCSVVCRDEALGTYHKYECKILELLIGFGMSILSHLALRMVTQKELKNNLKLYENRRNEHIFSLCTNSDKRNAMDFFRRAIMASLLLKFLQKVGYFGDENESVIPTENQLVIGEMLLFNLQILQFNAHEIYEKIHPTNHRFKGSKINYIGVGLYPTVALFNHQCYPSVTRYFVGKNIVINAIKPIKPGDVVAENYGPIFSKKPLKSRQKFLTSRYWFRCDCTACTQYWPMFNAESEEVSIRLRCPNESCEHIFTKVSKEVTDCPECKIGVQLQDQLNKLRWCEDQYILALKSMDQMEPENGIEILKNALDSFHKISTPPHKATHIAEETLRACYADLGNTYKSLFN